MNPTNLRHIPLAHIEDALAAPPLDAKQVVSLAQSIGEVGLIHPVTVLETEHGFRAVAGRHRLAAHRQRNDTHVPAIVLPEDTTPAQAELIAIHENLRRRRMSDLDEAQALARARELYEQVHPDAKPKRGRPKKGEEKPKQKPFVEAASEQTGRSRRAVERDTALGEKIDPKAAKLITGANHPIAKNKTELKKLAELPPPQQRMVAGQLAAGKLQRVPEAKREAPPIQGTREGKREKGKGKNEGGGFHPHAKRIEEELQELLAAEPDWRPTVAAWLENLADRIRG